MLLAAYLKVMYASSVRNQSRRHPTNVIAQMPSAASHQRHRDPDAFG
jgi:hypothetical protein